MQQHLRAKSLTIAFLVLVLCSAFVTFRAQTPQLETSSTRQTVVVEQDKNATNHTKLSALLADAGVQMGAIIDISNVQTYREVRVHWESTEQAQSTVLLKGKRAGVLTRSTAIERIGALPRERSLELSTDQLLVVALDAKGAVRWWKLMIDPRLVRAEVGSSSDMRSENYYRPTVDFTVECPVDSVLTQLRFYRPTWDGTAYHLEALGDALLH